MKETLARAKSGTVIGLLLACLLLLLGELVAEGGRWSAGIYGGYAASAGNWKEQRYTGEVNQFTTDFSFGLDLAFKLSRRLMLGTGAVYVRLNGSDWEEYVRSLGEDLRSRARFWVLPLVLRITLLERENNSLSVEAGPGVMVGSGQELYRGMTFEYDFLSHTRLAYLAGVQFSRNVADHLALSVRFTLIAIPSGLDYADNEQRTILAMPLLAGIRYEF